MFNPQEVKKQEEEQAEKKQQQQKQQIVKEQQSVEQTKEAVFEEKSLRRGEISIRDIVSPAALELTPF